MKPRSAFLWALLLLLSLASGCAQENTPAESSESAEAEFLVTLHERTFRFFWDLSDERTGLSPDRAPTRSFASVAATGFALTAYPIGVENGHVSRPEAARRVLNTLRFFWEAPQDSAESGSTGYRGFFYHFLDPETGHRFGNVELSTVDTALLLAGAFFCQSYFDGDSAEELEIRSLTDALYERVDWQWASPRPPTIGHGWRPESGHLPYDWRGYNEAMLVYLFALASPTHPVSADAWAEWTAAYQWGEFQGQEYLGFGPLFGHQYSHVWIDFRGIADAVMRERDMDYFENSRRAVLAQRAYARENPMGWLGYGDRLWGLTACDGPLNLQVDIDGRQRQFNTYWARGASFTGINDDGTICPSAAAASIAFAPEQVIPLLLALREDYGENIFAEYGFLDALNPSFKLDIEVQHGRVDPELGWFDTDYLGIDQGPILAMLENYSSELVWLVMRENPHVVRGLRRAGFEGGWLDESMLER